MQQGYAERVFQIVFNEISAAELSKLDTLDQLDLLAGFHINQEVLQALREKKQAVDPVDPLKEFITSPKNSTQESIDCAKEQYGKIEQDGRILYRYRSTDYRIYFEIKEKSVLVHRVLHKGTLSDFLFRSKITQKEDEQLAQSKHFWKLIDEGKNAKSV